MKTKIIKYGVTTLIGLLLGYVTLNNYGFFEATSLKVRYLCLSNAFTVPGVIITMCGALVWIAQQGMFDTLSYAGKMIADQFRPTVYKHCKYVDYVIEKREKRKKGGFGFLVIIGCAFLVPGVVFTVLYNYC